MLARFAPIPLAPRTHLARMAESIRLEQRLKAAATVVDSCWLACQG